MLDSSKIDLRFIPPENIRKYSVQKEFVYDHIAPEGESLWSRFWRWFWEWLNSISSGGSTQTYDLLKYFSLLVLATLVVLLVMKFIGLDLKIFSKKSKAVAVPYTESSDNIHEISFQDEIEKAISAGNYRLAVRLFYLQSLKLLSDKDLIDWQPEKTNQAYLDELHHTDQQQQFVVLTRQFEYIWYGEFLIDQESFKRVRAGFDHFNIKIR